MGGVKPFDSGSAPKDNTGWSILHFSNLAFIEMVARRRRETRQLVFARTVAAMNLLWDILGIRARTPRWMFMMVHPAARCSKVMVATVVILPAASGFSFNSFESAKEKLLACAAAINS